jgi:hypothetical protein
LRYHACDLLWIALYNDGLLQEILLQVLLNVHLCMLLYVNTSINLHVYIYVLVPVGLEHGLSERLPSSFGSKATGRSFPMVQRWHLLLLLRAIAFASNQPIILPVWTVTSHLRAGPNRDGWDGVHLSGARCHN